MDADIQTEDISPSAANGSDEEADKLYRCLLNLDSIDDALRTEAYQALRDYGALMPAADGKAYSPTNAGFWLCDRWNVNVLPKHCQDRMYLTLISRSRAAEAGNRMHAAIRLLEWKGILALPILLEMIDDTHFQVRKHIVHLINSLGDTTSLPIAVLTEPAFSEAARERILVRLVSAKYHALQMCRLEPVMAFKETPEEVCIRLRDQCDGLDVREAASAMLLVFEGDRLLRGSNRDKAESSVLLHSHSGPAGIDNLLRGGIDGVSVMNGGTNDPVRDDDGPTVAAAETPNEFVPQQCVSRARHSWYSYLFSFDGGILPLFCFLTFLFDRMVRGAGGSMFPAIVANSLNAVMMFRRISHYDDEVTLADQRRLRTTRVFTACVVTAALFWYVLS